MMIEMINRLHELERAHALPPETLIELDRWIRQLLFEPNDMFSDRERLIGQDYYISTLRRTA